MNELTLKISLIQANAISAALQLSQQYLQALSAELQGQVMAQLQSAAPPPQAPSG